MNRRFVRLRIFYLLRSRMFRRSHGIQLSINHHHHHHLTPRSRIWSTVGSNSSLNWNSSLICIASAFPPTFFRIFTSPLPRGNHIKNTIRQRVQRLQQQFLAHSRAFLQLLGRDLLIALEMRQSRELHGEHLNLDGPRRERDFRGDKPANEGPVIGSLGVLGDGIERSDDSLHGGRELDGFVVLFEAGLG